MKINVGGLKKPFAKLKKTDGAAAEKQPRKKRRIMLDDLLFGGAKLVLLALLCLFVFNIFAENTTKDVDIKSIETKMTADEGISALTRGDANTLRRTFSLDAAVYPDFMYYSADSLMDVSEVLVVKVSDEALMEDLENAVNDHLDTLKLKFDGYGTDQYGLLTHAVIEIRGPYFFFGVSDDNEKWEEEFLSCVK